MTEMLQEIARAVVHGEYFWLGVIIYTNMIYLFQQHGLDFDITTTKPCARSNRWKQLLFKILKPLLSVAKEMW